MNEPRVRIVFDGNGRAYRPGEILSGEYRLESVPLDQVKAIEVSVLWYTEGKGDEDLAVHHFQRISLENGEPIDLRRPGRFCTVLPGSPLSYSGAIVTIHWCVRVRVFLPHGKDVVGQREFQLGGVPPVRRRPATPDTKPGAEVAVPKALAGGPARANGRIPDAKTAAV
jgi:hypothetical protein